MNATEICRWIVEHASSEDLQAIGEAYKRRISILGQMAAATVKVGDIVQWKNAQGGTDRGTVTKVNRTTVNVDQISPPLFTSGKWRIPTSVITKVKE